MREQVPDLCRVRDVVLGHHSRNVVESDASDRLLHRAALPVGAGETAENLDVARPALSEGDEALGQIALVVHALTGDAVSVEVRKRRLLLGENPANANAVRFPLEVGEMPDVLQQRKSAILGLPPDLLARQACGGASEQTGGGFQS